MLDLYIVGAGGLGRGLADALIYDGKDNIKEEFRDIFFVDDANRGLIINDIYVKYNLSEFLNIEEKCLVINAMGNSSVRQEVQLMLNKNPLFIYPNYIDKDVKIYKHITLGKGNIITRGVVFSTNITIGDFNLIHFNCTIGHDVILKDFNSVYPLTSLSGYTTLGSNNVFGTNSCTLPSVVLGDGNTVGANSMVNQNFFRYENITRQSC